MAAFSPVLVLSFYISTGFFVAEYAGAQSSLPLFPNISTVKHWGKILGIQLKSKINNATGFPVLQTNYKGYKNSSVKFCQVNPVILVNDVAEKMASILKEKMDALNNSVQRAEKIAAEYRWNPNLKIRNVSYYDAPTFTEEHLPLEFSPRFQQRVNFTASSVHIPVEIYKGDIEILNGLKWSAGLDEVFKSNNEKDGQLLWQYFGSQTGFMRSFPASKWKKHGDVDLFDVRRRPWYTQGASSPKDMLIIIDTSGSVHGQALQLIKVSVKSLLDTLGENDFVNIAHFSKTAEFASCFNESFVQANHRNKKILAEGVENLTAEHMANFKVGFQFAFEQFKKFRNISKQNGAGAQCNEVIMLLTDGGTDNAKEIFEKYNWSRNKSVRVFTYAVGPTANPTAAIRWMACGNRGYFSQIPAMGAIRAKVQHYIEVLARPLALKHVEHTRWAGVYQDSLGLGMMTTVTLPVYNRTAGASNQTILGVMGVDVTTADMVKQIPVRKFGPNGYAFAINLNGYVVFHPNLKVPDAWYKDPPNVDFLEVEVENEEKEKLRRQMIDGNVGSVKIDTFVITPDEKHVYRENRTYAFTKINGTSFSLAVSIPHNVKHYVEVNGFNDTAGMSYLRSNSSALLIAPWDFYDGYPKENNITKTADDLISAMEDPSPNRTLRWNKQLMQHLYWDANSTMFVEQYWKDMTKLKANFWADILARFVGTVGGLTRVFPSSEKDLFEDWRNTWEANYFRRALATEEYIYMVSCNKGKCVENSTAAPVTVVKAVTIREKDFKAAVVGITMNHSWILGEMLEATNHSSDIYSCNNSENLICYLLDDGGFVISTNQEDKFEEVGQFLGDTDAELMFHLYNMSVYRRHEILDYQATCSKHSKQSAASLQFIRVPSINLLYDFLSLKWWMDKVAWSFFSFNIYNWLFSKPSDSAYAATDKKLQKEECILKKTQFYFAPHFQIFDGSSDCENCTRRFSAARIPYSNLALVVTDPVCFGCKYEVISQKPVQDNPDFCLYPQRYRRFPGECYKFDSREDDKKCGSIKDAPSYLLLLVSHLVLALCVILFT